MKDSSALKWFALSLFIAAALAVLAPDVLAGFADAVTGAALFTPGR